MGDGQRRAGEGVWGWGWGFGVDSLSGEDVEKRGPSCTAPENISWYGHY